jgi:hypothetical protein
MSGSQGATKKFSAQEAKDTLIRLAGEGKSKAQALEAVDKSEKTYEYYRSSDKEFARRFDEARDSFNNKKAKKVSVEVPDFPEFCEKYLGQRLFLHQLQWFDLLEGREPRNLHSSMTYQAGKRTRIIVNTPPHHAKSTTLTVNYALWRIVKNPDMKIMVVSKTEGLAQQFLLQVKERLTSPQYSKLQEDFGPSGGWKDGSVSWKAKQFYIGGRNAEAKDPTMQAIGIRGQIYGSRADLVILDDAIDNLNSNDYDKQIGWLNGIVKSRLTPRSGRLIVIGTRIAARDLYSELRDPRRYYGQEQPWTYLLQPAVLEYAEDPRDWVTLWPYTDNPNDPDDMPEANGLYRKWDGLTLASVRDESAPAEWSRIYQQEQIADDSIFKSELIVSACQPRVAGIIPDDEHLGRQGGLAGLRIIAGMDPAAKGFTAAVVVGFDPRTNIRYVLDVYNEATMAPEAIKNLIKTWTDKYGIQEWRIENNAFQAFLTRDLEIRAYLSARGCLLDEHQTDKTNKPDPNFGVMAMGSLFETGLIKLPNSSTQNIKSMIEQLCSWQPDPPRGTKTDIVMALWFAELRILQLVSANSSTRLYRTNHFTTRDDLSRRLIVSPNTYEEIRALQTSQGRFFN